MSRSCPGIIVLFARVNFYLISLPPSGLNTHESNTAAASGDDVVHGGDGLSSGEEAHRASSLMFYVHIVANEEH